MHLGGLLGAAALAKGRTAEAGPRLVGPSGSGVSRETFGGRAVVLPMPYLAGSLNAALMIALSIGRGATLARKLGQRVIFLERAR